MADGKSQLLTDLGLFLDTENSEDPLSASQAFIALQRLAPPPPTDLIEAFRQGFGHYRCEKCQLKTEGFCGGTDKIHEDSLAAICFWLRSRLNDELRTCISDETFGERRKGEILQTLSGISNDQLPKVHAERRSAADRFTDTHPSTVLNEND